MAAEEHLSDQQFLHVSPRSNRKSIRANGLNPQAATIYHDKAGVYAYPIHPYDEEEDVGGEDEARDTAEMHAKMVLQKDRPGPYDIWKFSAPKEHVELHGMGDHVRITQPVPPENVKRLK